MEEVMRTYATVCGEPQKGIFYKFQGFPSNLVTTRDGAKKEIISFEYSHEYTIQEKYTTLMDWGTLVSNVGGLLGLTLGLSAFTIISGLIDLSNYLCSKAKKLVFPK